MIQQKKAHVWYKKESTCMIQERKHMYDIKKKAHVWGKKESTCVIQERNHIYETRKKAHVWMYDTT